MQKPPPFVLTEAVHTTAIAPPNTPIIRGTSPVLPHSGTFGIPHNVVASSREFTAAKLKIEQDFQSQNQQLVQSIEQELAATRLEGNTHPLPPAQAITRELGVRHTLIARKTAQLHQKNILVNHFLGRRHSIRTSMFFIDKRRTWIATSGLVVLPCRLGRPRTEPPTKRSC
jgi:hypothetical protein